MTHLIRIEAPYFVAGVEVYQDRVVRAAPILSWSLRAGPRKLVEWARKKGFKVTYHD